MRSRRIFLIILDSLGIGRAPDAKQFGDEGANTFASVCTSLALNIPNLKRMGIFDISHVKDDVTSKRAAHDSSIALGSFGDGNNNKIGSFGRMIEKSMGKDTTIGHWEIAGIVSHHPLPVYPNGFPEEIITQFEALTGRNVLCNQPFSGTEVIKAYGQEHMKSGDLIVYTSADSVFQIAAHEDIIPIDLLYEYCQIARSILVGKHGVGRVIARPFVGTYPHFTRTSNRHDYSIKPPRSTILDHLIEAGKEMISIGKIKDIFADQGISRSIRTSSNDEGVTQILNIMREDFEGLCFANLVDFDSKYGHRNDVDGYARALSAFDQRLPDILKALKTGDILIISADHGCDPLMPSTDHTRETVPLLVSGPEISKGINIGTRESFADIAATIADYFELPETSRMQLDGQSFLEILK